MNMWEWSLYHASSVMTCVGFGADRDLVLFGYSAKRRFPLYEEGWSNFGSGFVNVWLVVDEFDREAPDMNSCWQTVCRIKKGLFVGVVVSKLGDVPA